MNAKLDAAIKAVCAIYGVSIGTASDRATWLIHFKGEATPEQRAAAQAVLESFDATITQDDRAGWAIDSVDRLQFEISYDMENRMRAREGLASVTRAQYRNALINRWKALNP